MAKTVEQKIAHINGTMAMEHMPLKSADKKLLHDCYTGKTTVAKAKAKVIAKYTKRHG